MKPSVSRAPSGSNRKKKKKKKKKKKVCAIGK
jgi:hypothetical protein